MKTLKLKNLKLMRKPTVLSFVRTIRKYTSDKEKTEKNADNIINRDFFTSEPFKNIIQSKRIKRSYYLLYKGL